MLPYAHVLFPFTPNTVDVLGACVAHTVGEALPSPTLTNVVNLALVLEPGTKHPR